MVILVLKVFGDMILKSKEITAKAKQLLSGIRNSYIEKIIWLRIRTIPLWHQFVYGLSNTVITLLSILFSGAIICFPASKEALSSFSAIDGFLTSLGATFGTILALVLTLSIIPIQRAGEAWSPLIVRLYRKDYLTHFIFIILGVFCTASFILSVKGVSGLPQSIILVFSFIILGVSLDLLRWYYRHICQLLDPSHAIGRVTNFANNAIDEVHKSVCKTAEVQYKKLTTKQKEAVQQIDLEANIYPHVNGYPSAINYWVSDLAEIASKGIARGEKFLANTAIIGIRDIVIYYLSSRKNNLSLYPAPDAMLLVTETDLKVVLDKAYEALQELSRSAVSANDESTAIKVSKAYELIAIYTENLNSPRFRENTAPLTSTPISYMISCLEYAHEKGLDEVPFQSAAVLSRISLSAPVNTAILDVHILVIDGIHDVALRFYAKRNVALAEHVIDHPMVVLNKLFDSNDDYFLELLKHVLEKFEILAPFAVVNEALQERLSVIHPLGKAYGLVNQKSLGYLFAKTNVLIRLDSDRDWLNPYREVVEILDVYQQHFRKLGESIEFGSSFLLWDLTRLIKNIAGTVSRMIGNPIRPGRDDEQVLVDKLRWVMSFFWVAFHRKKSVDARRADEACDALAYIGILFYERRYPDILESNVSHIVSIIKSYCQVTKPLDEYAVGDLFAHLWCLRELVEARDNPELINVIDTALNTKPEPLSQEQWQDVQRTIELRRRQLMERLSDINRRYSSDSSEELLRQVLG